VHDVLVNGLEFYGFHGVSDEEQAIGHRYIVDIRVRVAGPVADDLAHTVDYSTLAKIMLETGAKNKFRTVEAMGDVFCQAVLQFLPNVFEVELTLLKPLPPAAFIAASTGVRMVMTREEFVKNAT
jgi:dihydroneopterin aldolase